MLRGSFLTFAGVADSGVVETGLTLLTAPPPGVVQTLQTLSGGAVAAPRHAHVDVAVTFTGFAGNLEAVASTGAAVETFQTDVAVRT